MGTKEQQIEELTWKHFKKQKKKEMLNVLLVLFVVYSIVGVMFQVGWICKPFSETECSVPYEPSLPIWMMISGLITTGIWIIVGLACWLSSNWKNAKEEAEDEFKLSKGARKKT